MRWIKPNLKSIYSLLGHVGPQTQPASDLQTERIRKAMMSEMAVGDLSESYPLVARRIFYADTVHALWYVRSDLMTALAGEWGETLARQKMALLSRMFEGLLPEARRYRESRRPG